MLIISFIEQIKKLLKHKIIHFSFRLIQLIIKLKKSTYKNKKQKKNQVIFKC